jgi:hypothetical protein
VPTVGGAVAISGDKTKFEWTAFTDDATNQGKQGIFDYSVAYVTGAGGDAVTHAT